MDEKIRAEFFSRRFSLMQGTILGQIDEELDDDVFVKLITAYFHTVNSNLNCSLLASSYRCYNVWFLVADTQLYKRLCPSVGRSVGPSRSS